MKHSVILNLTLNDNGYILQANNTYNNKKNEKFDEFKFKIYILIENLKYLILCNKLFLN